MCRTVTMYIRLRDNVLVVDVENDGCRQYSFGMVFIFLLYFCFLFLRFSCVRFRMLDDILTAPPRLLVCIATQRRSTINCSKNENTTNKNKRTNEHRPAKLHNENNKNKMVKMRHNFDGLLDEDARFASALVPTFIYNNNL